MADRLIFGRAVRLVLLAALVAAISTSASARCFKDTVGGGTTCESTNQAQRVRTVTPSDSVDLPLVGARALFNGNATACNIAVIALGDTSAITWKNVQSGGYLIVMAKRVMVTGTTCVDILALYGG